MSAGEERRASSGTNRSNSAGDQPHRRSFSRPGRTKVDRNRDLPVDRQIRMLLKNPTPSPAEQNRLCELTRTKSYRAAVAVAKRMLVPPKPEAAAPEPEAPVRRRNPGNRREG
ncbi:hypothetical protein ABIB25_002784 [Nakamurella sp. UYEF19]|uniref:hypothetical protein n=1 Tax=Nakamurella sp. UYEF19 TaxID=1756392 RepID=UPI00339728E0